MALLLVKQRLELKRLELDRYRVSEIVVAG